MQLFPLLLISLSFGIAVNEDAYEDNLNQFIGKGCLGFSIVGSKNFFLCLNSDLCSSLDTNEKSSVPKFSTTTRNKISSLSSNRHRSQLMTDSDLLGDMSWIRFIQSFVDSASAMAEIAKSWANLAVKSQNESDDNTPEAAAAAVAAEYEKIRRRFCSPQRPHFLCCITYIEQIGVFSIDHIYDEFFFCGMGFHDLY